MVSQNESARYAFLCKVKADKAHLDSVLPKNKNRIEQAVKIVVAGGVEPMPDGTYIVRSNGTASGKTLETRSGDTCTCGDWDYAPKGLCKHRLAIILWQRATAEQRRMEALIHREV